MLNSQKGLILAQARRWALKASSSGTTADLGICVNGFDRISTTPVDGVFVSFKQSGSDELRSCMGYVSPSDLSTAMRSAVQSSLCDPRFPRIEKNELAALTLEVHWLTNMHLLPGDPNDIIRAIDLGKHAVAIEHGRARGFFLASVPISQGWDTNRLLEHLGLKAGLHRATWRAKGTRLFTFDEDYVEGSAYLVEPHPGHNCHTAV